MGFGLQHLKLGGNTSLETSTGIAQAHQRSSHRFLADPDRVIRELQLEISLGRLKTQFTQSNQILVFGLLELISGSSNLRNPLRVDQIPLGRQLGTHIPATGIGVTLLRGGLTGDLVGRRRDQALITTGVARQILSINAESGVPGRDLRAQLALGLIHLAGNRLEVRIIDLGQVFNILERERAQLGNAHLLGLIRQRQGGGSSQVLQAGIELGGGRRQHAGIGLRPRTFHLRRQGQGSLNAGGRLLLGKASAGDGQQTGASCSKPGLEGSRHRKTLPR